LKFDLRDLPGTVTSAELTCITSLDGKRGTVHVHAVYDNDWDEATLEGTDAPAVAERLDSAAATGVARQAVSWDVTAYVNEALSRGDEFASFALIMTDGYQVYFLSNEYQGGSKAPVLKIK
jgi:hypothetical protein